MLLTARDVVSDSMQLIEHKASNRMSLAMLLKIKTKKSHRLNRYTFSLVLMFLQALIASSALFSLTKIS